MVYLLNSILTPYGVIQCRNLVHLWMYDCNRGEEREIEEKKRK